MSESNRTRISYAPETYWNVPPDLTAETFTQLRITGESLNHNIENIVSTEIRSDRNLTALTQANKYCNGGINFEFTFDTFDDLIQSALFGSWSTVTLKNGSTKKSFAIEKGFLDIDKYLLYTGMVVNSWNLNVAAGQVVTGSFDFMGGWPYSDVEVDGTATGGSSTTLVDSTKTWSVDEHIGKYVIINAGTGVNQIREITDSDATSVTVGTWDVTPDATSEYIICDTTNIASQIKSTTWSGGGTPAAPNGQSGGLNDPFNAIGNVGSLTYGGSSAYLSEVSFSINNNLRNQPAIGFDRSVNVAAGKMDITGTVNAYFTDTILYSKFLGGTDAELSFTLTDADSNSYAFTFPKVRFESDSAQAGGQDADVMETLNWRALYDSVEACMIKIVKSS